MGSFTKRKYLRFSLLKKCLLISRIAVFLLLFTALQVNAKVHAQDITINAENMPVGQVFRLLKKQTGYSFLWDNRLLPRSKKVDIHVTEGSLEEVLNQCLSGMDLGYKIQNQIVYIVRKDTAPDQATNPSESHTAPKPAFVLEGTVTDAATHAPLVAASVYIKGTSEGTTTNTKGQFQITASKGDLLVISYLGYETKEITVTEDKQLTIELSTSSQSLNDMVVTGVFSRPKANFTGASTSFTAEDLSKVSNNNLFATLSALDPSFHITENINTGSDPNKMPDIVIRGGNSLVNVNNTTSNPFNYAHTPNMPLFILDGFEATLSQINDLDMNRIRKVDILKDAAATAIYGSRAANGVVVIETIQPEAGKLRLTYTGNLTIETPDLTDYNLLDAERKFELEQKAGAYSFGWNERDQELAYFYNARLAAIQKGVNTDWIAQPVRTGVGQKHTLYLEGGGQEVQYGINLTYHNNKGTMKGSHRRTITGSTYLSYRINNFQFRNKLTLNFNKGVNSPYGSFRQYTRLNPYWSPYDSSGHLVFYLEEVRDVNGNRLTNFDLYDNLDGQGPTRPLNPLYNTTLHTIDQTSYQNIIENFSIQWQATDWLRFNSNFAYQRQADQSDQFFPAQATRFATKPTFEKGTYTKGNGLRTSIEELLTANIHKYFGKNLIFATAGLNIRQEKYSSYFFTVEGFPNSTLDQLTLGNKFPDNSKPTGSESLSRMFSLLSNLSYSYDNRYLLDFSFRGDGSSKFGSQHRFAPLWSAGVGWNLHNEDFLKNQPSINRLKLRYSFGYTGSQNFPSYLGVTTTQYYTDREYRGIIPPYLLGYGNAGLSWQKTQKNNLGIDVTLFNKLDMTANYYLEKTQGSIATVSTAPSTGFDSYSANLGNLESKGWELNIRYMIFSNPRNRNRWSVFLNATGVKTTITDLSEEIEAMNKRADTSFSSMPIPRYAEGQSTTAIWAVPSLGIDPASGQEILVARNGELVTTYNPLDKKIVGDSRPEVEGTFGTNFEMHGIGINLYFRYRYGGQTYNQTLIDRVENIDPTMYNTDKRVLEERWQQPGDHTFFKGLIDPSGRAYTTPTYATSRFVQDYDLLSLENASVYYRFSDELNAKLHVQNTKITLYTADLFRLSSIRRERGLDYPYSHTYTIQLTTTF